MNSSRSTAPKKRSRPGSGPDLAERTSVAAAPVVDGVNNDAAEQQLEAQVDGFLREFEAGLRDDPDVSDAERDAIVGQFSRALKAQIAEQASASSAEAPADWNDVLSSLRDGGLLETDDTRRFVAQLDEAMKPFQERDVQLAIEFGVRSRRDGKEKALEWYRTQLASGEEDGQAAVGIPDRPAAALNDLSSTIKSRSRRLRGPPR